MRISLINILWVFILFASCKSVPDISGIRALSLETDSCITSKKCIHPTDLKMQSMGLVNVQEVCKTVKVQLKYNSEDNFLGLNMYNGFSNAYLQVEAVAKLAEAERILMQKHLEYSLVIYDAARPLQVQQIMWDSLDVPLAIKFWYVADPSKGSIHNYGMAVDVSVLDEEGIPIDMGTPFDYFGDLAFPGKESYFLSTGELDSIQVANRELLYSVMLEAGFSVSKTEWWHYNAGSLIYAKSKYEIIK